MIEIRDIQTRYCSQAMMASIIISCVLIFLLNMIPIGKGLILGTLFSIINFVIIGQTVHSRILKSRSKANGLALLSIFIRFTFMAVPLVVSLKLGISYFIGTAIGLFMVQFTMLFNHLILEHFPTAGKG